MNRRLLNILAVCCLFTVLGGCVGSSPATRYYALNTDYLVPTENSGVRISVGPFEIPDYLNRPQIVVRGEGTELQVLKFDRWAEPLSDAATRRINQQLNNLVSDALIYQFPNLTAMQADYRVRGRIYSFEADQTGTVVLRLRWGVLDKEGQFIVTAHGSNFSTTVESSSDIGAVTAAMGELLDQFAAEIAVQLKPLVIE